MSRTRFTRIDTLHSRVGEESLAPSTKLSNDHRDVVPAARLSCRSNQLLGHLARVLLLADPFADLISAKKRAMSGLDGG